MKIYKMRTNHVVKPMGFSLDNLSFSWVTESEISKKQSAAQVRVAKDERFESMLFDSGKRVDVDSLSFQPDLKLEPRQRYYWQVTVWGDGGDTAVSEIEWFETGKMEQTWSAEWVSTKMDGTVHPLLRKSFTLLKKIASARAYVCGLGLYEFEINGKRVGQEYFTPGYHSYDFWLQVQTYDVTEYLSEGENAMGALLGNGWYKGRFGFDGGYFDLYGDRFAFLCELVISYEDGTFEVIKSDKTWKSTASPIHFSGIYDGEIYDANDEISKWSSPNFDDQGWQETEVLQLGYEKLKERLSLPVLIKEEIKPLKVLCTPKGEKVLDMGQNMTGWIRFNNKAAKGKELLLQYGEILQEDCFYQENLRTAKAEFRYISNGQKTSVQPHFTFYGFRYVKLTGFDDEIDLEDFTGCVIYSDLEQTGNIETSNPLVNQLFQNALWGQKGNFLDVPTDCPQRDERMGWTGDAQIFASTACYNMYSPAFYTKYMHDLRLEQVNLEGSVPFFVPALKPKDGNAFVRGHGSTAWGDAATIIPWTLYLHYADKSLLKKQFDSMKDWVDYIKRIDDATGSTRLWTVGFHFADWLALDGKVVGGVIGGTDSFYIASAYYCYSVELVAKAAKVLGEVELSESYSLLAQEIRSAILKEYFTQNGRCAIHTQTAMVVALFMNLVPDQFKTRIIGDLKALLLEEQIHLKTGFVGTPYLCPVLSNNGVNDFAYRLLLNEDYPSWLYAVKLGATTIWERWNSVLAEGSISGTGMNSLNHYAYGSIAEWMYRTMCGINPCEDEPGFKKAHIEPQVNGRIQSAKATLLTAAGYYESKWEIGLEGDLTFHFKIPFNATAEIILPDAVLTSIKINDRFLIESDIVAEQKGEKVAVQVSPGSYCFAYLPTKSYLLRYSSENYLFELLGNDATKEILTEVMPELFKNPLVLFRESKNTIRGITDQMFKNSIPKDRLSLLDEKLKLIAYS